MDISQRVASDIMTKEVKEREVKEKEGRNLNK